MQNIEPNKAELYWALACYMYFIGGCVIGANFKRRVAWCIFLGIIMLINLRIGGKI